MQLDYLTGIRGNGALTYTGPSRLVRICRFDHEEAAALMQAVQELAEGKRELLWLEDLPFIQSNGYSLAMQRSMHDEGLATTDERVFILRFTEKSYHRILQAMAPLCHEGSHGSVWLTIEHADPALLFSSGGSW